MSKRRHLRSWILSGPAAPAVIATALIGFAVGCSSSPNTGDVNGMDPRTADGGGGIGNDNPPDAGGGGPSTPGSPFKSLESVANDPEAFSEPRAGVPLPDGSVAFIATLGGFSAEEIAVSGSRIGVWLQPASGGAPSVLYAGDRLANPYDLDVSLDGKTLYVADLNGGAEGRGALLTLPVSGGEPTEVVSGGAPRAVTVAHDGRVYFSGIDEDSGQRGVFLLAGGAVTTLFAGAPFVDPSGIAILKDGGVLVADTSLFDGPPDSNGRTIGSESGVVLVKDGQASIFATGFVTGYPAGIALTADDQSLIISGQGPDRSDTVYIVAVADPEAPPTIVTDKFSAYQDSSGGLKRAHDSNTFIWASLSADCGTVYRILAK